MVLMVRHAIRDEQLRDEVKNESVTDFFAAVWLSLSLVVTLNCLNWPWDSKHTFAGVLCTVILPNVPVFC